MNMIVDAFKEGWSKEADWKGQISNPPREALCSALAGKILEATNKVNSSFPSQVPYTPTKDLDNDFYDFMDEIPLPSSFTDPSASPLMKEETPKIDWKDVASELGRGARRSYRSFELYPVHALCWGSILLGALRLNKNAFSCVATTVTCTVWCAHSNPITQKLHPDAQLAASKIEEAMGIGRKHLHKTLPPLAIFAVCIWFIPKSLEGPATMIYGGGLGSIFGHIVGAPNEWTPPTPPPEEKK
ncbi:MAG: hypothetical protein JSR80_06325 [Verrucomicrobia bacterium]|nr:hypothetical protein [Verrucomicrobiota bacterium]